MLADGCEMMIVPGIYWLFKWCRYRKAKTWINDLLGRDPIEDDIDGIMEYVSDSRHILQAGGSIGELCRQIASSILSS